MVEGGRRCGMRGAFRKPGQHGYGSLITIIAGVPKYVELFKS